MVGLERVHQHGCALIAPHLVRARAPGAQVLLVGGAEPTRVADVIAVAVHQNHFLRTFGYDDLVILVAHGRAHLCRLGVKLHFGHHVRVHEQGHRAQVDHRRRREFGACKVGQLRKKFPQL